MVYCRKGDRYGKGLFIESGESVDDVVGDTNQSPEYDVGEDGEEELIQGDEGPLLIVRRACFTPHKSEGDDWHRNIFQSNCTIGGKVCRFEIDSGSCENMVSKEAMQKLGLERAL